MSMLQDVFVKNSNKSRKTLIPYITMGFPKFGDAVSLVSMLGNAGADIIEVGIPFSDPLADGSTIQNSSHQAIENGMTLAAAFDQIRQINLDNPSHPPLVVMTYYNIIYKYGLNKFVKRAAKLRLNGLIVPDLPFTESSELRKLLGMHNISLIYMITPNTVHERIVEIVEVATGFLYLVSVSGVTGVRSTLPEGLEHFVKKVQQLTSLPLALGFGISSSAMARSVTRMCDGVIIGSALIQQLSGDDKSFSNSRAFIASVSEAINE